MLSDFVIKKISGSPCGYISSVFSIMHCNGDNADDILTTVRQIDRANDIISLLYSNSDIFYIK